jgi:transketolase
VKAEWRSFNPREEFGKTVVELGRQRSNCMVLAADLARTCHVLGFQDARPDNFFNVGICEQNMVGLAAGLAFEGKVPIVTSIAPFIYMRACEQVRTDVCYNNLHVLFVPIMSGISGAPLGSTHYGTEDLAVMRAFPNMKVLQPSNARQIGKAMQEAYDAEGPVYIRLGSGQEPDVPSNPQGSMIGRAIQLRDGAEVSILATGYMVHKALEAADLLVEEGISAGVWDHPSIKPIDDAAVLAAISGSSDTVKLIVTLEEHNLCGGFGSAVAEVLAGFGSPVPLEMMAIPDLFVGVGSREDLLRLHHLDTDSILRRIKARIEAPTQ